ncbi:MAG: hypothetical protein E7390_06435 [Ruminococcaceae bacterium]|nr:hypothetical protein [Oscillospiraceae bacterium]
MATVWSYYGHEPIDHLRRMESADKIFSPGEWTDAWYQRMHSEELLEKAKKAHINTVFTHFFKGFGLEYEKAEMKNTRRFTEMAHKKGIRVLGYLQFGGFYSETMPLEMPEWETMLNVERDGSRNGYYRFSSCYNSPEFIAYLKKVIVYGIKEIGLDGFHFDNSICQPCWCERCKSAFRKYLKENMDTEKFLGLRSVDYVDIPPYDFDREKTNDSLYLAWENYKAELSDKVHAEIFQYVKAVSDGKALVLHNPGFPSDGRRFCKWGYEPQNSCDAVDFVFAENSHTLGYDEEGRFDCQVAAYRFGERFGYRVFNTGWRKKNGMDTLPETPEAIKLSMAEGMIYGGICGGTWTFRSMKDGDRVFLDDPDMYKAFQQYAGFFLENADWYEKAKGNSRLQILWYPASLHGRIADGLPSFIADVNTLTEKGYSYNIVVEEDLEGMGTGDVLLVPDVWYVRDETAGALKKAAERGCRVILLGKFGLYNEWGKRRADASPVVLLAQNENIVQYDSLAAAEDDIRSTACDFSTDAELLLHVAVTNDGKQLLHMINPHNETPAEVYVNLPETVTGIEGWISPDGNGLCAVMENGRLRISNLQTMITVCLDKNF